MLEGRHCPFPPEIWYGWMREMEPAVLVYKQHLVTNLGPVMKRFLTRETGAFAMVVAAWSYLRSCLRENRSSVIESGA